jgi:hypothetical protein
MISFNMNKRTTLKTRRTVGMLVLVAGMIACQSTEKKTTTAAGVKQSFDSLEAIFETGNWQTTWQGDTVYLFFSREAPAFFKVWFYNMRRGDSVNTWQSSITVKHDSIYWNWPHGELQLLQAGNNEARWQILDSVSHQSVSWVFTKTDSLSVRLQLTPGEVYRLRRTLPIGAFLVRSKYDFVHGTQYARDSVEDRRE